MTDPLEAARRIVECSAKRGTGAFFEAVEHDALAVARALLAQAAGWQPIETAPRDGTIFIAYQNEDIYRCRWRIKEKEDSPPVEGWWDVENWSFEEPTHWHPLPAPPGQEQPPSQAVADAYRRGQEEMRERAAAGAGVSSLTTKEPISCPKPTPPPPRPCPPSDRSARRSRSDPRPGSAAPWLSQPARPAAEDAQGPEGCKQRPAGG